MERRDFLKIALGRCCGRCARWPPAPGPRRFHRNRWPRMAGCPPIRMLILPSRQATKSIASSRKKCDGATAIIAAGVIVTGAGATVIGAGATVIGAGTVVIGVGAAGIGAGIAAAAGTAATTGVAVTGRA